MSNYQEDWDFYFSNVDDVISSFYIDLGLIKVSPITNQPNLVWISVNMKHPREDGLSSQEEFDTLSDIEDRLQEVILAKYDATYAGRLTSNGKRDLYFYIGDITLHDKSISEAMVEYPSYTFDFGVKEDADWKIYSDFMYPTPKQLQSIQNRRVVENLEEHGDPLTEARPVDHWIYFETDNDRDKFLNKIRCLNFDVIHKSESLENDVVSYSLQISRIDYVDYENINESVLELWELANECNGDYDGWETSIEKPWTLP